MKYIKSFQKFENILYLPDGEILGKWDPSKFQKSRLPIRISEITNKEKFSSKKVSVLDMLIKLPGGDIKIPTNDASVREVVDKSIEYEKKINKNWENYYMYLTVHYTEKVKVGKSQRNPGAHLDCMQGSAYKEK